MVVMFFYSLPGAHHKSLLCNLWSGDTRKGILTSQSLGFSEDPKSLGDPFNFLINVNSERQRGREMGKVPQEKGMYVRGEGGEGRGTFILFTKDLLLKNKVIYLPPPLILTPTVLF